MDIFTGHLSKHCFQRHLWAPRLEIRAREQAACKAMQSVIQTALLAQKHHNDFNRSQPNDPEWLQHPSPCSCRPPDRCSTPTATPLPVFAALNSFSLISIDLQEDKVLGTVTVQLVWFRSRPNSLSAHSFLGVFMLALCCPICLSLGGLNLGVWINLRI